MMISLIAFVFGLVVPSLPDLRNYDGCVRPEIRIPERTPYRIVEPPQR